MPCMRATGMEAVSFDTLGSPSRIERYYDETWLDYRFLWLSPRNLAFHFGHYDAHTRSHAEALVNANRTLAELAGVKPGATVLDAGCGVGGSALWLARERDARVVGITLVKSQVEQAKRVAAARSLDSQVAFLQADFTQVPFARDSFDIIWALESLCHAADKPAFYREAARVLKPGGRLVIAEYMRTARPLDAGGERMLGEFTAGWEIPDLDTAEEHRAHAAAAGLVDITVQDNTARVWRSLRRLYRISFYTYLLAWWARTLRIRSATQHGNVVAAIRQFQAARRQLWRYGILSARKP